MSTYYVFKPGFELSAEVEASNSKHARTAFLDYLSRKGLISWKDRQTLRDELKVSRVESGESNASMHLRYSYEEEKPMAEEDEEAPATPEEEISTTAEVPATQAPLDIPGRRSMDKDILSRSPIAQLSRQQGQGLFAGARKLSQMPVRR